jgi:hypothetical protein
MPAGSQLEYSMVIYSYHGARMIPDTPYTVPVTASVLCLLSRSCLRVHLSNVRQRYYFCDCGARRPVMSRSRWLHLRLMARQIVSWKLRDAQGTIPVPPVDFNCEHYSCRTWTLIKFFSNIRKGGRGRNKPSKQGTLIWPHNSLASHFFFFFLVGEEAHQQLNISIKK